MLIKVLISVLASLWGYLACSTGCLICRKAICLLCDKENSYYQINTSCTKKVIENCVYSDNGEICLYCAKDYYPDSQSGKCLKSKDSVPNCLTLEDSKVCLFCEKGFYKKNNECAAVTLNIPNCRIYTADGKCLECETDFFLSEEIIKISESTKTENSCVASVDLNCSEQGAIICTECLPNFKYYKNTYLYLFKQMTFSSLRKISFESLSSSLSFTSCSEFKISNCSEYEEFDRCSKCLTGYFVNEDYQCELMPEEAIDNCFEYYSLGVCRKCLEGYHMTNPSNCIAHTKTIESCLEMDQHQADVCALCVDGYYLTSNKCLLRRIIQNCSVYDIDDDLCSVCDTNFLLSADFTKCFAVIESCMVYDFSGLEGVCTDCLPGFYLKPGQGCSKVPLLINGCLQYTYSAVQINGNNYKCSVCQNEYYMNASTSECTLHDVYIGKLATCRAISPTISNTCVGCLGGEILKTTTNYCEVVDLNNSDEFCNTYNSTSVCTSCLTGYYVDGKTCKKISIINCDKVSPDATSTCIKCASSTIENYYVSSSLTSNKCYYSFKHIINNCVKSDDVAAGTGGAYSNTCNSCYSPYYPDEFNEAQFCVAKSKLLYNYSKDIPVDNCKIYTISSKECQACIVNTALNLQMVISNKICSNACVSGSNIKTFSDDNFFYCSPLTIVSCFREEGTKCVECLKYFLPDVSDSTVFATSSIYDYLPAKETNHFQSKSYSSKNVFNRVPVYPSCTALDTTKGFAVDSADILSSKYSIPINQPDYNSQSVLYTLCKGIITSQVNSVLKWGCVMCKFGFTGYYVKVDSASLQFISRCDLSSECNLGVYWDGIGNHLASSSLHHFFVGCHKCNNETLIPTYSRFERFSNSTVGVKPETLNTGYYPQTTCLRPGIVSTNTAFPVNCAVQEIIPSLVVEIYVAGSYPTSNPYCVACKPGYRAVLHTPSNRIIDCVEITNCNPQKGFKTFNKCISCSKGYVLNDLLDKCVPNDIENCYQGTDKTAAEAECSVCIENYAPSRDKRFCNYLNMDNCLTFDFFRLNATNSNVAAYRGSGCISCELGYIATRFPQKQKVCIWSNEIAKRNFTYIGVENCQSYDGPHSCSSCSVGFTLPSGVSNICILSSSIANCAVYNADESCKTCAEKYLIRGAACVDGSNYITNCLVFTSDTVCAKCQDGYVPMSNANGTFCYYALGTLVNCIEFDTSASLTGKITCLTCKTNYYPKTITYAFQACIPIPKIPSCKSYNITTYECKVCLDEYYLQNATVSNGVQKCLKRKNYPYSACQIIDYYQDNCQVCIDGYSVRNKVCTYKPSGIANCDIYTNSKTCTKCKNNSYLFGNACRTIPIDNIIANCKYYSDTTTCTECLSGYFLAANTCQAILISNCQILKSAKECLVCKTGYFLTEVQACTGGKINNCVIHSSLNECKVCETTFYVDKDKKCVKVLEANIIPNCKYYATNSTCSLCMDQTLLAQNAKSCFSFEESNLPDSIKNQQDPNCVSFAYQNNCRVCKGGYLFQNDVCQPCNENQKDCHFCDFRDNTNCFVCVSGSYQDDTGKCVRYIIKNSTSTVIDSDGTTASDKNSTNATTTKEAILAKEWIWMWLILTLMFLGDVHVGLVLL